MTGDGFKQERLRLAEVANAYLTSQSHTKEMSDAIAAFMKRYDIGESAYGKLMDVVGSHVTNHRLYGHHVLFNFPSELSDIPDFLLHELSDLFTNYGLPVLPAHVVEGTPFYSYCSSITDGPHWNMLNGFDVLAGTLAIYQGVLTMRSAARGEITANGIPGLARTFGVGACEFALAMSTANPLLLIGCFLHVAAGIYAVVNDAAAIHITKRTSRLCVDARLTQTSLEHLGHLLDIESVAVSASMEARLARLRRI